MKNKFFYTLFFALLVFIGCCFYGCQRPMKTDSIIKVEMHLSAFGVESDEYPSIDVIIDFENDSSKCSRWFYNPSHKPSIYKLSNYEMKKALKLLQPSNLEKLKVEYRTNTSDEPTSTTTIYTSAYKYTIKDYGLVGDYPCKTYIGLFISSNLYRL
jgi:hypothetical protein